VTAADIAARHGEKTEQYHDLHGPSVPQDAAEDDEREPISAGLISTLPAT